MHAFVTTGTSLISPMLMTATTCNAGDNLAFQPRRFSSDVLLFEEEDEVDLKDPFVVPNGMAQDVEEDLMASISLMDDGDGSISGDHAFFSSEDFDANEEIQETLYEEEVRQYIWYDNFSLLRKISKKLPTVEEASEEDSAQEDTTW